MRSPSLFTPRTIFCKQKVCYSGPTVLSCEYACTICCESMSDTAIAEVQRRATEKLPHFVYPPAKPKLMSGAQTLLLVSDNLEKHEL